MFFDSSFLVLIPAMILAFYAQSKVSSTYAKYAQRSASTELTGSDVARRLLDENGLQRVRLEPTEGRLTDHYDPRSKVLRLSQENYRRPTIAALAVAAHEVGHAVQDANGYAPLAIRNNLVPVVSLVSNMAWPLFLVGLFLGQPNLQTFGIFMFSGAVLFQAITLPVEFDASRRAVAMLEAGGYVRGPETEGARDMLQAAALTYVAAMAMALSQLLRMLMLRNRRR